MKRILLVDDDKTMLFAFRKLCKASSVLAETADTIEAAMQQLNKEHFDIIITDLNLTGACEQEGLEIIRAANRLNPLMRAFIWSAYDENRVHDSLKGIEIEGYLVKPVKFDDLVSIINSPAKVST